jgi:hypothetical protein
MDGLCVRAYYRVDEFSDGVADEDKFQFLMDNYCAD